MNHLPEGLEMVLESIGGGTGRVVESLERSMKRELMRADLRGPGV